MQTDLETMVFPPPSINLSVFFSGKPCIPLIGRVCSFVRDSRSRRVLISLAQAKSFPNF